MEKNEYCHGVSLNTNWCSQLKISVQIPQKVKLKLTYGLPAPVLGMYPKVIIFYNRATCLSLLMV